MANNMTFVPTYKEFTDNWNDCARRIHNKDIKFKRGEIDTVQSKGKKRHFFIKSMICKALLDNSHHFLTEAKFHHGKEADIYDASTDTVIEIETHASDSDRERKMDDFGDFAREVFIIDPTEWPERFHEVYKKAEEEFCWNS